ncbi:MAG: IscS subfamily cysteine desulfurase [Thermodesulfovibrionales bacterium]
MKVQQKEKRGICGICPSGCWVVVEFDSQGRISRLRPDEGSPMGMLCRLGEHAPEIVYSENRLLTPLRRKGPKGTYEFVPISWDEAYTEIRERLNAIKREYGPEAVAIYTGVGTFELSLCDIFQPRGVAVSSASSVLFPFGSPNTMGVGALCYVSYGMIAPHLTTGKMLIDMFNDIENSDLIVVWGTNPATDQPPIEMRRISEAHARGASIVVIDPRRTQAARFPRSDWIPIRHGTDGALALGLCNVLIEEELYDERFVRDWAHGFDDFSRYVQHFRPETVEQITGVPAEKVVSLARRLAGAKGASQLMYTGLEYSRSGVQSIRASLVLWALSGQLDVPGGRCFSMPGNSFPINRSGHVANPDTGPRLGRDRFPLYIKYRDEAHAVALPQSVLEGKPYKIRSLIIQGASIITSWPQPEIWKKTLSELEFLVTIDRQFTADAAFADIVLPASTFFEGRSYMVYGPLFKIREPLIEPLGQSRPDYRIMTELAQRLGYGHLYPQEGEALLRHVLDGSGFTYEQVMEAGGTVSVPTRMMEYRKWEKGLLRADGRPGFDTPTGKFEIHSNVLEEYGYDPLPVYTEPAEGPLSRPDLFETFPLVFNSGSRSQNSFHTQHIGTKILNEERPEPGVLMNTEDAEVRGIKNGDRVRIMTPRGSVLMRAKVTDNIMRGAVDANHAGGGPLGPHEWREANVNRLTDLEQFDPISGFPVYKCLLCEIEPARDGSEPISVREKEETLGAEKETGASTCEVYLDNNATTALATEVATFTYEIAASYGNPSSIHKTGNQAKEILEGARRKVAAALGITARRITFTGSGSEANNLAIKGVVFRKGPERAHVITSAIEHPSVLEPLKWLERLGAKVTYLSVDSKGMVDPDDARKALTSDTVLISVMLANNETGTIEPIAELARVAHEVGILMHTDAVQAFGKVPVNVAELGVDMLSISAHKLHGPKGVGALYTAKGVELESLVHGGGQELGMRSGTENVLGIAGFGHAAELMSEWLSKMARVRALRDSLESALKGLVPDMKVNGHPTERLPNTLNVVLPGLRGESIVLALDRYGVRVSSGSACKSGSPNPSHVLLALGLSEEEAHCSVRISLGSGSTVNDIELTVSALGEIIKSSRNIVRFVPCR